MIEKVDINGTIKRVEILTDEDSGSREHCAYRIVVETEKGRCEITGCHDMGPDAFVVVPS